jgi:drug/metabolite transporter (DMT)-like permease
VLSRFLKLKNGFLAAAIFYIFAVFLNNFNAIIIKKYSHVSAILTLVQMIAMRSWLAAILTTPIASKNIIKIHKKDIILFIFVGLLAFVDIFLWHTGVKYLPVNNAVIMSFSLPILISIMAFFILKERIYISTVFAIIIGVAAVFVMYRFSPQGSNIGYFILAADFIIGALGFVLTKKLSSTYAPITIVYSKLIIVSICCIAIMPAMPVITMPIIILITSISALYIAERYLLTAAYSLYDIIPLQPLRFFNIIFTMIVSYLILNESIHYSQIIAAIMVLIANYINIKYAIKK